MKIGPTTVYLPHYGSTHLIIIIIQESAYNVKYYNTIDSYLLRMFLIIKFYVHPN